MCNFCLAPATLFSRVDIDLIKHDAVGMYLTLKNNTLTVLLPKTCSAIPVWLLLHFASQSFSS